jgi:hypothetical protein
VPPCSTLRLSIRFAAKTGDFSIVFSVSAANERDPNPHPSRRNPPPRGPRRFNPTSAGAARFFYARRNFLPPVNNLGAAVPWQSINAGRRASLIKLIRAAWRASGDRQLRLHVDVLYRHAITVGRSPDAPETETMVVEVTPRWRAAMRARGVDWTTPALRQQLIGRQVQFTGWLLFDTDHVHEAVNTAPGKPRDWRKTVWEIHPVTVISPVR